MSLLRDSHSGFKAASCGQTLQSIYNSPQSFICKINISTILEYAYELHPGRDLEVGAGVSWARLSSCTPLSSLPSMTSDLCMRSRSDTFSSNRQSYKTFTGIKMHGTRGAVPGRGETALGESCCTDTGSFYPPSSQSCSPSLLYNKSCD